MRKVLNIYIYCLFSPADYPRVNHGMDSNFVGKIWPHLSNYEDVVFYNFLLFQEDKQKMFPLISLFFIRFASLVTEWPDTPTHVSTQRRKGRESGDLLHCPPPL